jgi:4-amino-4-deoxy-L-arabinose transferase-like glycosyltransferase
VSDGILVGSVRATTSRGAGDDLRAPRPGRSRKILLWLVFIGMALRLCRYLADRSLWLDETYLANSILTFSFHDFFVRPLLQWQAAPIGFLLLEKLAVKLLGTGEYALRLVPLLAGLASVPLFYCIIRRCLEPTAQVLAMALFITLEPLVYYSSEAKQYGIDVVVALAVVLAAMRLRQHPRKGHRMLALAVIGACGIFLSHPAVFTLAAAGIVLLLSFIQSRERKAALQLIVVGIIWLGLFAVNYLWFLRPLMHHAGLAAFWASDYMPHEALGAVQWLGLAIYDLYHNYATMWLPLVDTAMIATVIGIVWFWKNGLAFLGLLLLPLLLVLGAAAIHAYPFGNRLVLFGVPGLVVLIGAGMALIWEGFVPGRRWIAALIVASVLVPTAARAAFLLVVPIGREEIRPMLAYIRDHKKPGDTLYIFCMSEVPFHYYEDRFGLEKNRYGLDDMHIIFGKSGDPDPSIYRTDLAQLRGRGRVWVLITHPRAMAGIDEEKLFPEILKRRGTQTDHAAAFHASVTLYEMAPSR